MAYITWICPSTYEVAYTSVLDKKGQCSEKRSFVNLSVLSNPNPPTDTNQRYFNSQWTGECDDTKG